MRLLDATTTPALPATAARNSDEREFQRRNAIRRIPSIRLSDRLPSCHSLVSLESKLVGRSDDLGYLRHCIVATFLISLAGFIVRESTQLSHLDL